jgi:hypothetical protein
MWAAAKPLRDRESLSRADDASATSTYAATDNGRPRSAQLTGNGTATTQRPPDRQPNRDHEAPT